MEDDNDIFDRSRSTWTCWCATTCSHFCEMTVRNGVLPSYVRTPTFSHDPSADSRIDATHIFDGLDGFPTHVAHMRLGRFVTLPSPWDSLKDVASGNKSRLYSVALQWLKEDRDHRRELEKSGRKRRGAQNQEVLYFRPIMSVRLPYAEHWFAQVPTDSETFYSKYVTSLTSYRSFPDHLRMIDTITATNRLSHHTLLRFNNL